MKLLTIFKEAVLENKWLLFSYIFVNLIIFPLSSIGPSHFSSKLIANLKDGFSEKLLITCLAGIVAIYTTTQILYYINGRLSALLSSYLWSGMKSKMYDGLLQKYKIQFGETKLGKIITQFDAIPRQFDGAFWNFTNIILPYGLGLFVLIFFFLYTDRWLGICYALYYIVSILLVLQLGKYTRKKYLTKFANTEQLNEHVQDRFSNLISVISSNTIGNEKDKFSEKLSDDRKIRIRSDIANIHAGVVLDIAMFVLLISLSLRFYKLFMRRDDIDVAFVSRALLVFITSMGYNDSFVYSSLDTINRLAYIEYFYNQITTKSGIENADTDAGYTKLPKDLKGNIEFKNVTFNHGTNKIHSDLNIKFSANKINGIIGPSGSGKSTIGKIILLIYKPQTGDVFIDGVNIKKVNVDQYRDKIALVEQDTKLFQGTVSDNMTYGIKRQIKNDEIDYTVKKYQLSGVFQKLGDTYLNKQVGSQGTRLSTGQRQTVLMIRAILHDKPILLLDEPTASLDKNTKYAIYRALRLLKADKTIILITHDTEARNICDTILDLSNKEK